VFSGHIRTENLLINVIGRKDLRSVTKIPLGEERGAPGGEAGGGRGLGPVTSLLFKHASASPTSGEWNDDDYDVVADGVVVGRITPWMWTLASGADALCDRLRLLTARLGWNTEDSRRVL
jgi:hypothetical protein